MRGLTRSAKAITAVLPRSLSEAEDPNFAQSQNLQHYGSHSSLYQFNTPSGKTYRVAATKGLISNKVLQEISLESPQLWGWLETNLPGQEVRNLVIAFEDEEGSQGATGEAQGDQFAIFSEVIKATINLLQQNANIPLVRFGADSRHGTRGSRSRMYERFARKLSGQNGYAKVTIGAMDNYIAINPYYQGQVAQVVPAQPQTASRKAVLRPEEILDAERGIDTGYIQQNTGSGRDIIPFYTPSGREYKVSFIPDYTRDTSEFDGDLGEDELETVSQLATSGGMVSFAEIRFSDDQGSMSTTGRGGGEVHDILNSVAAIVKRWIQANPQIAVLYFSGSDRGRVAIYKRLTRMINPQHNFVTGSSTHASFYAVNPHYSEEQAEGYDTRSGPNLEEIKYRFDKVIQRNLPLFRQEEDDFFQQAYEEELAYFTQKLSQEGKSSQQAQQEALLLAYESARSQVLKWGQGMWVDFIDDNIPEELDDADGENYRRDYEEAYTSPYTDYFHALPRGASRRVAKMIREAVLRGVEDKDTGLEFKPAGVGRHTFFFKTPSGRPFEVEIAVTAKGSLNEVANESGSIEIPSSVRAFGESLPSPFYHGYVMFSDEEDSTGMTGKGEAMHIISGVAAVLSQFLRANPHIATIDFSGTPASRVRVYDRLSKALSGNIGYVKKENYSGAHFYVPSRFYSAAAAEQFAAKPLPEGNTTQGDSDWDGEDEDEAFERRWEEATERYEAALEQEIEWRMENYFTAEVDSVRERYEEDNKDEKLEDYIDEIATPIYKKLLEQARKQRLLWDDPALVHDIEEQLWDKAEAQAKAQAEVSFEDWWDNHLYEMEEDFGAEAQYSLEDSKEYWEEEWRANNSVEDYME